VVVIDADGRQIGARRVMHTPAGLAELTDFLLSTSGAERKAELACIIETTHGLWIAALLAAGYPVYPVNPKTVDRKRSAAGAKTDRIDAYLLAKHGRSEFADLRRLEPDSPLVAELKTLTRDQDSLIQMQTRLVNQLTACLKAYSPVALSLFAKVQQRSSLRFLQAYPTPQAALAASEDHLTRVLKQAGHPTPKQTAAKLVETLHQPALHADEVTTRTKSRLMLALVRQLEPVMEEIANYDREIDRLFLTHADRCLIRSLPRAGKRLAPRLLAELGDDRRRYQNAASLQALAGTSPVPDVCGKYAKPHRRYACIKPLRNALQQFGGPCTQKAAWALDSYQRKRAQGKTHSVAVRALANLWCRMRFALWTKRECSQTNTFEAAQQRHPPRAA
jgi:transposase